MAVAMMVDDGTKIKSYVANSQSGPYYPAEITREPFGRRVWTDERLL